MTPVTVHGLTIEQWTATVLDMQRELQWIRSQRHLRADEHHKQLQQLWEGATRPQREAITEFAHAVLLQHARCENCSAHGAINVSHISPFLRDNENCTALELVIPTGGEKGGGHMVVPLPFEAVVLMQEKASQFVLRELYRNKKELNSERTPETEQ
jgi:hypothetical protein